MQSKPVSTRQLVCLLSCCAFALPQARAEAASDEMLDLSLEQLSNIIITSVSRQEEKLSDAAAAIFIINAGDIRRSGARSIPEALRLAPNLQVARVDARNYAVTARGFNSPFENKLLMLIDGRTVYSPLFSGVFWDVQDLLMEDIERIEVISGPGATIWGANAVNGVINVITRSARDTLGGLLAGSAGSHERDGQLRYGAALSPEMHYRVYGKYSEADATENIAGLDTHTGWRRRQAGFRGDWRSNGDAITVSGDAYQGALGQANTVDIRVSGANLQSKFSRKLAQDAELSLHVILDHTERNQPNAYVDRLDSVELLAQHGLTFWQTHKLIWGLGYRLAKDTVVNGPQFGFLPGEMNMHWGNVFAQDEIALRPELRLTAGLKMEHNNYTGVEYLPNLRLAWHPAPQQLLWTSLSRTVRAPSRIDRDLFAPSTPLIIAGKPFFVIGGGPQFESEVARVAELGYRAQPRSDLNFSVTAYYSAYDKLRTLEPHPGSASLFSNFGKGTARGVELWGTWQVTPAWRLNAGGVLQSVQTSLRPESRDAGAFAGLATNDPNRHWTLRSSFDISERSQLDLTLRYTSALPKPVVPAYYELDMQWLWQLRPDIDLALIGQNLLHASHPEFNAAPGRSVFERSAMLRLSKRF
ncbi:TonB-dependent receptor [Oxalobacteraceae bacterium]|nr:TonB-dependent receptor [Oxalobacteraceae bacterium]